ncbi:MAG: ATP cone domain-containing protein, partial [Lentimicrobiaceae bacterium]|nr:ATP cone domain-containing protein [Lentimicrobiaceae bacterium]
MTVIKKDGRIQDFDIEKMRLSIAYASDDAKAPMTDSDINLVVKEVMASVESLETQLNTATIRKLIIDSLIKYGFTV